MFIYISLIAPVENDQCRPWTRNTFERPIFFEVGREDNVNALVHQTYTIPFWTNRKECKLMLVTRIWPDNQ